VLVVALLVGLAIGRGVLDAPAPAPGRAEPAPS
jgi:hypothetical protein